MPRHPPGIARPHLTRRATAPRHGDPGSRMRRRTSRLHVGRRGARPLPHERRRCLSRASRPTATTKGRNDHMGVRTGGRAEDQDAYRRGISPRGLRPHASAPSANGPPAAPMTALVTVGGEPHHDGHVRLEQVRFQEELTAASPGPAVPEPRSGHRHGRRPRGGGREPTPRSRPRPRPRKVRCRCRCRPKRGDARPRSRALTSPRTRIRSDAGTDGRSGLRERRSGKGLGGARRGGEERDRGRAESRDRTRTAGQAPCPAALAGQLFAQAFPNAGFSRPTTSSELPQRLRPRSTGI